MFEVTDRGRPVDVLCPLLARTPMDGLGEAGEVSMPLGNLDDLPAPLALGSDQTAPSVHLARIRADER